MPISEHQMLAEHLVSWTEREIPDRLWFEIYNKEFVLTCRRFAEQVGQLSCPIEKLWNLRGIARSAPEGPILECGTWQGLSASVLHASRPESPLILIDSFEGLSAPHRFDGVSSSDLEYTTISATFRSSVDQVRSLFFRKAQVIKGWIPEILMSLPERRYALVHIDLDRFLPTLGAIQYFRTRMLPKGIIVEDQFLSIRFPGAGRAWRVEQLIGNIFATGQMAVEF
jgi:hypothetical protein